MRTFFFSRNWRERVLLLTTLAVGVGIWMSSLLGRVGEFRNRKAAADSALGIQTVWLGSAADNAEQLKARLAQVQKTSSLNSNQLVGKLNELAGKRGLAPRVDPPASDRRPPVIIHSVSLSLERVEYRVFLEFVDDLAASLPLVNIDQMTITPERNNSNQLGARLRLSSLELSP